MGDERCRRQARYQRCIVGIEEASMEELGLLGVRTE